jgi:hypothetical protein
LTLFLACIIAKNTSFHVILREPSIKRKTNPKMPAAKKVIQSRHRKVAVVVNKTNGLQSGLQSVASDPAQVA